MIFLNRNTVNPAPRGLMMRVTVHLEDEPVSGSHWITDMPDLETCQRTYIATRDRTGLGGSRFGDGEVFDADGTPVARISYNGRAWPAGPWEAGAVPLAEAPRDEAPA